ncbi:MAG: VCBS repeat-containing protein, partial [Bacteroidota bacterium]
NGMFVGIEHTVPTERGNRLGSHFYKHVVPTERAAQNLSALQVLTALIFCFLLATGCQKPNPPAQFQLLRQNATGLNFQNDLPLTSELNPFNYLYFFNGGGVAAADFIADGLTDLFFTANFGENKLFLNRGDLKFEDVTTQAGVASPGAWKTGVSVADVNNDGLPDLYVNRVGGYLGLQGRNELFICQGIENGIPKFQEMAAEFGLDLTGLGTQAAFFDYDLDGDLDLFQLTHSVHQNETYGRRSSFPQGHPTAGDKFLRNDGGKFLDVTEQVGILSTALGYGLGIVAGDINLDGYPDIYIGNDFHENDYLYLNMPDQKGGRIFQEILTSQIGQTSRFSMGVDMADFNNDGWNDIVSLDMMPYIPEILKSAVGEDSYDVSRIKTEYGYHYQQARNALQLNTGNWGGHVSDTFEVSDTWLASQPHFQEIAMFANVHATDWSWAALFFDFDHDGLKDLFVSNGIVRRLNDLDYINFLANNQLHWKRENADFLEESDLHVVEKMPRVKLPNRFFKNTGSLRFEEIGDQVKGNLPTYSNGAACADFDNDGDLDVVVNNLEDEPFIYKNLQAETPPLRGGRGGDGDRNYLSINLKGSPANRNAIGAKAIVFKKGERLLVENYPVRGFESSSLGSLHLGVGDTATVDSILLIWHDNTFQRLSASGFNLTISVEWKPGLPPFDYRILHRKPANPFQFSDVTGQLGLAFRHEENAFIEFNREPLIPHQVSTESPALAVGDVNGDGLEDVFFGSSHRKKSALFLQQPRGKFLEKTPPAILADSLFEDVDAVFADLENDGDLDLVIAAGGNEYRGMDEPKKQRFYRNDGNGNFQRVDFQGIYMTAACVLPADFNGDGLVDFFFGARAEPWNYGITPKSALLKNKGNGEFENVPEQIDGGLQEAGLVKNGAWSDVDADGDPDLVLAIEWEPLTIFLNNGGKFEKTIPVTSLTLSTSHPSHPLKGWWNFVLPHDFDGDGDVDILAGNLGENAKFKPTENEPVKLYVNDFDGNGQVEQILSYWVGGKEIPFAGFKDITKQLPPLKKQFLFARDFAKASLPEIFGKEKLEKSIVREANELRSMYFENTGGLKFTAHPLPAVLQFSPLAAAQISDLDGDGKQEVILAGNFFDCAVEMGRYDANFGNVLRIGKAGKMEVFSLGDIRLKGQ